MADPQLPAQVSHGDRSGVGAVEGREKGRATRSAGVAWPFRAHGVWALGCSVPKPTMGIVGYVALTKRAPRSTYAYVAPLGATTEATGVSRPATDATVFN
jgi:hypothetical protein